MERKRKDEGQQARQWGQETWQVGRLGDEMVDEKAQLRHLLLMRLLALELKLRQETEMVSEAEEVQLKTPEQ